MLYHVRRSVRNDKGARQNHMGWKPMLQGQPRWFNVIFSRQAEIVPIGMGYIWEVKGNSFQIFKSTPIFETPHGGREAQRLSIVGSFSFPTESVRSHPNSRPPPASNPRTGRIFSICRAKRGGGRGPLHREFSVDNAGEVSVPSARSTPVTFRFPVLQNEEEIRGRCIFPFICYGNIFTDAPQRENRSGFIYELVGEKRDISSIGNGQETN